MAPESEASEILSVVEESDEARSEQGGGKPAKAPQVWEIDFCSRPILDERRKKVWRLWRTGDIKCVIEENRLRLLPVLLHECSETGLGIASLRRGRLCHSIFAILSKQ